MGCWSIARYVVLLVPTYTPGSREARRIKLNRSKAQKHFQRKQKKIKKQKVVDNIVFFVHPGHLATILGQM
jgi:hypothetical protein